MILSKHLSFWGYAGLWSFYNPTLSYNNFYAARFRARDEIMSRAPLFQVIVLVNDALTGYIVIYIRYMDD